MPAMPHQTVAFEPWSGEASRWQRMRGWVARMLGKSVKTGEQVALNLAPCGHHLKIVAVEATGAQARRLTEMGLYDNAEVSVLCGQHGGSLIVCIDSYRLAVSPAMAEKIRVTVLD